MSCCEYYDVIIVGAGCSGLYAALNLAPNLRVLVLSKREFAVCNSALAQGGVAAVLDADGDSVQAHIDDTVKAGGGTNNIENLRILVENGAVNVEELARLGVEFDRDSDGAIALGLEGGHSRNRIAHHKDSTGEAIISALIRAAVKLPNADCLENAHLLRLTKPAADLFYALVDCGGTLHHYTTKTVLIATGGIGRVYNYTTNSAISTGDGIMFAEGLGAEIAQMSLIQFHPTAFYDKNTTETETFLITEATRGEGAYIYNKNHERFLERYGASELSPRDVVSRCILEEEKRTGSDEFYLDISHVVKVCKSGGHCEFEGGCDFEDCEFVKTRFPMIYRRLLEKGYDFTKQPVPIYPCQHYHMGGIAVSANGRTRVDGLYAAGECAYTGVHGNNRLASNSLLEALVFSRLAAEDINSRFDSAAQLGKPVPCAELQQAVAAEEERQKSGKDFAPGNLKAEIRAIMQKSFFVSADYEQTRLGIARIGKILRSLEGGYRLSREYVELYSLAKVAHLILLDVALGNSGRGSAPAPRRGAACHRGSLPDPV